MNEWADLTNGQRNALEALVKARSNQIALTERQGKVADQGELLSASVRVENQERECRKLGVPDRAIWKVKAGG